MIKFRNANSPRLINSTLAKLLGPAEAKLFWKKYLDSLITNEDISFIKEVGFIPIGVPFNYPLFVLKDQTPKFGESGMFARVRSF